MINRSRHCGRIRGTRILKPQSRDIRAVLQRSAFTFAVMKKGGCIYFMANANNKVLYVGVTSYLIVSVYQHKTKAFPISFTGKYNCFKLVYYESFQTIEEAIAREKNIKQWKREWKDELINKINPGWNDIFDELQ